MSARRVKSLHHNLGDKNVPFHRDHRSKKGREKNYFDTSSEIRKKKLEKLKLREIERDMKRYRN